MPSLKDLKNRISSVKSTRKITKAMQMVAAAKLRRAQDAAEAARPYADKMADVVNGLAASVAGSDTAPKLLAGTGNDKVHLLVVMTAERGLCGWLQFAPLLKLGACPCQQAACQDGQDRKDPDGWQEGPRTAQARSWCASGRPYRPEPRSSASAYDNAADVANKVFDMFDAGEFDVATIFFNRFESVISQIPTATQVIPAVVPEGAEASALYDYEPSEEAILADLLPRAVTTQIFTALLENGASEQGARMSAMDNATRNAGDMIDRLTTEYNRSRQAAITKELIEIISGAEAL